MLITIYQTATLSAVARSELLGTVKPLQSFFILGVHLHLMLSYRNPRTSGTVSVIRSRFL